MTDSTRAPAATDGIVAHLASPDAHVREDALLAVDELDLARHPELGPPLDRLASDEGELPALRVAAAQRLGRLHPRRSHDLLRGFVVAPEPGLRWRGRAILAHAVQDEESVRKILRDGTDDPDPEARLRASVALAIRDESFDPLPMLGALLESGGAEIRIEVLKALGALPLSTGARELVARVLETDTDEGVRAFAEVAAMMMLEES